MPTNAGYLSETENIVFTKFQNHSSAQAVKLNIFVDQIFNFFNIDISNVLEEITFGKIAGMILLVISQQNI